MDITINANKAFNVVELSKVESLHTPSSVSNLDQMEAIQTSLDHHNKLSITFKHDHHIHRATTPNSYSGILAEGLSIQPNYSPTPPIGGGRGERGERG